MTHHYVAEREHGSDWCIRDVSLKGQPICSTGLDQEEAETTANEWNARELKKKKNLLKRLDNVSLLL
jgi:hypothetical protein